MLDPGTVHDGHDRLYVPRLAWTTGDLDIHDIVVDATAGPVFVNTLFSCLATPAEQPQLRAALAAALHLRASPPRTAAT